MNTERSQSPRSSFERAYLAMSHVLGEGAVPPSALDSTRELASRLSTASRHDRAILLAAELGKIAASVEARRIL